jgi:AbrB family looped-hinge helix DNA binding protein
MTVKVSPKYQVVIPEEVRRSLNIKPGMQIDVIAKGGVAYLVPVKSVKEIRKLLISRVTSEEKREMQKTLREKKDRKFD